MHLINSLGVGGAESMLLKLATESDRNGRRLKIRTILPGGELLGAYEQVADIKRLNLNDVVRLMRGRDTLICWMYHSCLVGTFFRILNPRLRLVWNVRHSIVDLNREKKTTRLVIKFLKKLRFLPTFVVFNSSVAMEQHFDFLAAPDKGIVIPNGFELEKARGHEKYKDEYRLRWGVSPGTHVVGVVARFHPMKGHAVFLKALESMPIDVFAVFAGKGTETKEFEDLVRNNFSKRWIGLGIINESFRLISSLDLLVVPSEWGEGFPNVIGEAMLSDTLVVATDVGDSRIILGDSNLIAEPSSISSLAAAMQFVMNLTPEEKKSLKSEMRQKCESMYSISSVANQYSNLEEI